MTDAPPQVEEGFARVQAPPRVVLGESAETLRLLIEGAFQAGARSLLIDVAGCAYMDSSGIGELLAGMRLAREAGGGVALIGPRGKIHEILEVTQLAKLFVLAADDAEARRALTRPS